MRGFILLVIIGLLLISPKIFWHFKETTEMNVLIIDKTVPNTAYREHNGLLWFLTNEKIVKPNGELYNIGMDYFGYDPYEEQPMSPYQADDNKDLIYIADTYGVYSDDLEDFSEGDRSEKLYGGMNAQEWNEIMRSKGPETIFIAEYNGFASPTDEATRNMMEKDLNVEWTGWIGRYFDDLNSSEVPPWLRRNYEAQHNNAWPFKNGGLAFVHTSDIVIIIDEKEVLELVKFKMTKEGERKFPTVNSSEYHYWFDIIEPVQHSEVLAQYQLSLSQKGQEALALHDIPTSFPAVTYNEMQNTYYFSGDFADYTKDNLQRWQYGDVLMRTFSNDEEMFFWATYIPLMREIVKPTN